MSPRPLLAVPNVSEGRDRTGIDAIARAFGCDGVRLLDVHSDPDHHRSVFTLAGAQGRLSGSLLAGARETLRRVDVGTRAVEEMGAHPHVGALDVVPLVYLDSSDRGAACAEALVVAHEIGELGVPVLLYGELAGGRTRAELRKGGVQGLATRLERGDLPADFGPPRAHPSAGATLVAAREPLVAFNVELAAPSEIADARRIAELIRDGGVEGLPGLRAIGVQLRARGRAPRVEISDRRDDAGRRASGGETIENEPNHARARVGALGEQHIQPDVPPERARCERQAAHPRLPGGKRSSPDDQPRVVAQVSTNVERPLELPLREVLAAVRRHAPVACVELVGLAPRVALDRFPSDVKWRGGDPAARTIEKALGL